MHLQNSAFRSRALAGAVVLAAATMLTPAAFASPIQIAGTTAGCFGAGCSNFDSEASGPFALSFTGTSFDVTTSADGSASFGLGSIGRGNSQIDDTVSVPFLLEVDFVVPAGLSAADSLTAIITGKNSGGGGPAAIDFVNDWQTLTFSNAFGSGSFDFAVLLDYEVTKNGSTSIAGSIRNVQFTPVSTSENAPPVSEPAAMMLMAVGLAAAARTLRRRGAR